MTVDEARQQLLQRRNAIDALDERILELLNQRAEIASTIGDIKKSAQLPVVEASREQQVIANMSASNQGPLDSAAVERIFERIMLEMRRVQQLRMEAAETPGA
jgi:chorismate mutase-like protein